MSLPVRECGLKHFITFAIPASSLSLPVRECGLKPDCDFRVIHEPHVTPRAGVWIETSSTWVTVRRRVGHSPCGSVD